MTKEKKYKRRISLLLIFSIIFTLFPWTSFNNVEASINVGGDAVVEKVTVGKLYDNDFNEKSIYLQITGQNLADLDVRYGTNSLGFKSLSNRTDNSNGFIKFIFTSNEAKEFNGQIMIGETNKIISVDFNNVGSLTDIPNKIINVDSPEPYYLTFNGNNFSNIGEPIGTDGFKYEAEISKKQESVTNDNFSFEKTENTFKVINPKAPGEYGLQDMTFRKIKESTVTEPTIEIERVYEDVFQFVKELVANDIALYPNIGAIGENLYLEGKDVRDYSVYFLSVDGNDNFTNENKAIRVRYEEKINGTDSNKLTIAIPNTISIGQYYIALTNTNDGEVIAQKLLEDNNGDKLIVTVIDKSNKAQIDDVNPTQGPDLGGQVVEILGTNLITLNIDGLALNDSSITTNGTTDTDLVINYNSGGTYNGEAITEIKRTISAIIGKDALIQKDELGNPNYKKGSPDHLYLITKQITDIEDDPYADIKLTITTTFKKGTKEYRFVEIVEQKDRYKFIPSSIKPIFKNIVPSKIQVNGGAGNYNLKDDILVVINGQDFMVDKNVDESGTITKYPIVLIKNENNLNSDDYEIKIDKTNDTISYYDNSTSSWKTISDLEYYVLDDKDNYINGTKDNEIGSRIIFKLPKEINLSNIGKKNIQIVNPRKGSDLEGDTSITLDAIEFITVSESPIIESVKPNIVTVDGGEEIIISGSNFQEGVEVYIDGKEVKNITRDLDINGKKILLKFKSPKGREGSTQILVVNPDGGMDVEDFTFVKTINKDPLITNISPNKGSQDTLVIINGDNFLKPDPSIKTTDGMGIYRLIGSRILLDNKEINIYNGTNTPELIPYTSPNVNKLFDIVDKKLILSQFYKNTVIKDGSNNIYWITKSDDEVILKSHLKEYIVKLNDAKNALIAVDESGQVYNLSNTSTEITINPIDGSSNIVLSVKMDNKILSIKETKDNTTLLSIADYYNSVVLKDTNDAFYTLDVNPKGAIILTDGNERSYTLTLNKIDETTYEIIGLDLSNNPYKITVSDDRQTLTIHEDDTTSIDLKMYTPYTVDSDTNVIVGHRVKVLNKNQLVFTTPQLDLEGKGEGWYNVTVKNPDTKEYTKYGDNGFYYYVNPSSNPQIYGIYPNQGSVDGGYSIIIKGSGFEDTTKVYIDGLLVDSQKVVISADGKYITVIVPPYKGDITAEFETDKKTVPVVILNKDGGSASIEDGFTYVVPNSHPEIYKLTPDSGKASGDSIIEITGYDFRYFEPYKNRVGGPEYNIGDIPTDLNNNGKWDSLDNIDEWNTKETLNHNVFSEYYTSPILPKVYFGDKEAKVVDFSNGYLKVIAPSYKGDGTVDVYLVNNDSGISNVIKFKYSASKPKISAIVPNIGKKQGKDIIEIIGEEFANTEIEVYMEDGINTETKLMPIVRFGDITNRKLRIDEDYSGRINNGRALVKLDGNLEVEYKVDQNGIKTVKVSVNDGESIYTKTYEYDDTIKYISLDQLENSSGIKYYGYELIKIEVENKRFLVDRGFSPLTERTTSNQIKVTTPSYHTVGKVNVSIINPDSGMAISTFEYKNPGSRPKIYDITPKSEVYITDTTTIDYYVVDSTIDGGVTFKITGEDFRKGVTVLIGSQKAEVLSISNDDKEILVKSPKGSVSNLNRPLLITVYNEDGAIATSKDITVTSGKPIYYMYKEIETKPRIESITPNKGSAKGGERIVITGYDFRTDNVEDITVRIGANTAQVLINESTYKKLVVITPASDVLGSVDVFIRNNKALGEVILESGFTYYSNPTITSVSPYEVYITGGQEVTISGTQFTSGMEVYIGEVKASKVTLIDENTLKVTTPAGEEGYKDIKLIASDGGEAILYNAIRYILPIPSTPTLFIAKAGHERSVILTWNESTGADRYKIYAKKSTDKDYVFIGETKDYEYYLKDLSPDTYYYFKLYSVNEYGESRGYAYSSAKTLKTTEDKLDDKYTESKPTYDVLKKSTTNTIVQIPKFYSSNYTVDLTRLEDKYTKQVQINIPIKVIKASYGNISIFVNDLKLNISVDNLKQSISSVSSTDDTNVVLKTSFVQDRDKSRLESKLSRNEELYSDIYKLELQLQDGRKVEDLYLSKNIEIGMLNEAVNNKNIKISVFDDSKNKFILYNGNSNEIYDVHSKKTLRFLNTNTNKGGIFTLIKQK